MTIPVVRKRAKRPKTRTGCRTCRARRIKCDEERPICRRCTIAKRECHFDNAPSTSVIKAKSPALLLPKAFNIPSPISLLKIPTNMFIDMAPAESFAYEFFRKHTVKELPGSAWALSWERLALQMGHDEPAMAHASVALGALHQALTVYSPNPGLGNPTIHDRDRMSLALSQYNKAMAFLRTHIEQMNANGGAASENTVEVVLLVNLLFFCFEVLLGEDARAAMHLRTGLRILCERSPAPTDPEDDPRKRIVRVHSTPRSRLEVLLQTFIRLDYDSLLEEHHFVDNDPFLYQICDEPLPSSFTSLEQAMVHLDSLQMKSKDVRGKIFAIAKQELTLEGYFDREHRPEVMDLYIEVHARYLDLDLHPTLSSELDNLKSGIATFMSALASLRPPRALRAEHLLIQIQMFDMWLTEEIWRFDNETAVDKYLPEVFNLLVLVDEFVGLSAQNLSPVSITTSHPTPPSPPPSSSSYPSQDGTTTTTSPSPTITSSPSSNSSTTTPHLPTRPAFTLGTGVVGCLAMTILHCRDGSFRRRGIDIVRQINMQGIFDNLYLVDFLLKCVDMEESWAREINLAVTGHPIPSVAKGENPEGYMKCSDIPEAARFRDIQMLPVTHGEEAGSVEDGRMYYKSDLARMAWLEIFREDGSGDGDRERECGGKRTYLLKETVWVVDREAAANGGARREAGGSASVGGMSPLRTTPVPTVISQDFGAGGVEEVMMREMGLGAMPDNDGFEQGMVFNEEMMAEFDFNGLVMGDEALKGVHVS